MSYYFYVLYSLKDDKLYKGYSSDFATRFTYHQSGGNKSTKHRRPLVLIYIEAFQTKKEAMEKERWAKSKEGGPALKEILKDQEILDHNYKINCGSSEG